MHELYDPDALPAPPYETARLLLRPLTEADAEAAHAALDVAPEMWRFDPGHPRSLEDRREVIRAYGTMRDLLGFAPCGAFLKETGEIAGLGGLNPYVYDHRDGSRTIEVEVMFRIALPFQGRGLATETSRFWVAFAFDVLRLPVLRIGPDRDNAASVAVLRKLGARIEDDWLDPDSVIATIEAPADARATDRLS